MASDSPKPHPGPPLASPATLQHHTASLRRVDRTLAIPLVIYGLLALATLLAILLLNGGTFIYTLDDPYIHLALARSILHGHYGINPAEFAAPSSSILWPLLLAPFMGLPGAELVPLLIGWAAAAGTLAVFHRLLTEIFAGLPPGRRDSVTILGVTALALVTNQVGLPFTGMEHSLQTLLALLVFVGLLAEHQRGRPPWWLWAAIVLGPLVRYENLVLAGPALLYLLWRRHYRPALLWGGLLAALLIGFSLFLSNLGLGLLPSSVLAKSIGTQSDMVIVRVLGNLIRNAIQFQGVLLLVIGGVLSGRGRAPEGKLALVVSGAIILHLLIGRFGWFSRYEIYIWSTAVLTALYLYRASVADLARRAHTWQLLALVTVVSLAIGWRYLWTQAITPVAANNIYEQHYQMSRFVAEYYRRPVAVNDLGLVAYGGGQHVLDFYGLGSRRALELKEVATSSDWMVAMAEEHDVRLAMLYEKWYKTRPASWIPLGDLYLSRPLITPAFDRVTFYAFDAASASEALPLLRAFQASLPPGVRLELRPGLAPQP